MKLWLFLFVVMSAPSQVFSAAIPVSPLGDSERGFSVDAFKKAVEDRVAERRIAKPDSPSSTDSTIDSLESACEEPLIQCLKKNGVEDAEKYRTLFERELEWSSEIYDVREAYMHLDNCLKATLSDALPVRGYEFGLRIMRQSLESSIKAFDAKINIELIESLAFTFSYMNLVTHPGESTAKDSWIYFNIGKPFTFNWGMLTNVVAKSRLYVYKSGFYVVSPMSLEQQCCFTTMAAISLIAWYRRDVDPVAPIALWSLLKVA